ncbi:hypothetical protein Pmani_011473 [Petrolisthes manimaculis]|uniref:Inositol oxygenase n=1 Tax=Petrolisthes manimaculis TaxID=1843537 RepID=A0AAE1Q017_9EUCA|nr:hypothetical protein Pmani_011473 [Petrolisthes manimaculis]
MSALEKLNDFVDESDPDVNESNIIHAFQTAERLREAHPEKDWLHLTGLIHDLGMVMAFYGEPQWSTTGDTFVVGCEFVKSIVYRDTTFKHNPDLYNPKFKVSSSVESVRFTIDEEAMDVSGRKNRERSLSSHSQGSGQNKKTKRSGQPRNS